MTGVSWLCPVVAEQRKEGTRRRFKAARSSVMLLRIARSSGVAAGRIELWTKEIRKS